MKSSDFLEKETIDNVVYYLLPKGTKIYRGESTETPELKNIPTFFGITKEEVKQYGIVHEYVIKKDIQLLALDNEKTQREIYNSVKDHPVIKNILKKNYGYGNENIRNSEVTSDKILVKYLCENNYNGYATDNMPTAFKGTFHKEILLCSPAADLITYNKQVTSPKTAKKYKEEDITRRRDTEMKESRRKNKSKKLSDGSPESSEMKSMKLFGDSPQFSQMKSMRLFVDSPPSSPMKSNNLFEDSYSTPPRTGGVTKRRKYKLKKTRKSRKQ